jgi:hypothetical protein
MKVNSVRFAGLAAALMALTVGHASAATSQAVQQTAGTVSAFVRLVL